MNLAEDVETALALLAACSCNIRNNCRVTQTCSSQQGVQLDWALGTSKTSCNARAYM